MRPFEQIVNAHGRTVLRVCRAVLGPADAEDAWSETFLAALKAYPDVEADTNVEAWLITIAHRKAIDVIRSRRKAPIPSGELPERASDLGVPGTTDHELWRALARLPEKQRRAVAYHHVAGLPHKEVAAILGGSTEAARRAAADGISSLRRTYERSSGEPEQTNGNAHPGRRRPPREQSEEEGSERERATAPRRSAGRR